jgi:alcohol dehydrogenase class IV
MKAIGAVAALGGVATDYMDMAIASRLPPIAIPTTAGAGSEAARLTIIADTENDVRILLKSPVLMPFLAVVDPVFMAAAPSAISANTGLDALCQAIEPFLFKKARLLSNAFAVLPARRIFSSQRTAYEEPSDTKRANRTLAATEAGIAFNNSSAALIHGMSRPIGALFHVPHGLSNAMLMGICLEFIRQKAESRLGALAKECVMDGSNSEEAVDRLLSAVTDLLNALKILDPSAYGIDSAELYEKNQKWRRMR